MNLNLVNMNVMLHVARVPQTPRCGATFNEEEDDDDADGSCVIGSGC